ncbi:MAG: serine/threonine protein kinase [Lachnospiraceae bacterium]
MKKEKEKRIGIILDGKYEILREIGHGGMSVVYLAMDVKLNKQWAIKEFKKTSDDERNRTFKYNLMIEANLMKNLDHPALPRIVSIIDDGNSLFVIMDYIEGENLNEYIKREGAQPEEIVLEWGKQLCDVLRYLHSQNPPILYRDMKPNNVMRKPDDRKVEGNLKVIDFGIAKEYKIEGEENTSSMGTPGYASPEQMAKNGQIDVRSDIYSFGATLYFLATNMSPYFEPNCLSYPISHYVPQYYDTGLEKIIQKCVQPHKEDRYQNCDELMFDLEDPFRITGKYNRKQKRRLKVFTILLAMFFLSFISGISFHVLAKGEDNKVYDEKIGISEGTDYKTKIQTYGEAIELMGNDTRAYEKLLQAYEDNGTFGDEESNQFVAYYNKNKSNFETEDSSYLELNYKIGIIYFYLYSGGDGTFRTRVLKAFPYFEAIVNSGREEYENYNLANSYYILCNFYKEYVNNSNGMVVKEPKLEDYEQLVESMNICVDNIEDYENEESSYIKLIMFNALCDLINDHRTGFVVTGMEKTNVLQVLEHVYKKAQELSVTQTESSELKTTLNQKYEEYVKNIERAYTNAEERS